MLIGLSGQKGSGKDTAGAYLVKEHGFERVAFAHPMKKSIANLFDIPYHVIEKYKNDPRITVTLGKRNHPSDWEPVRELSFREFMQHYGTEAHRGVFGEMFWVDISLPLDGFYDNRNIVVTDVRFNNEARRVRDLGGIVIYIARPILLHNKDPHRSETTITNYDHHIDNDGTVEELYDKLEHILVKAA